MPTAQRDDAGISHEAEMIVLGACMLSAEAVSEVIEIVRVADFRADRHTFIYDAIIDLYSFGRFPGAGAVCTRLNEFGNLEAAGGESYVCGLIAAVPFARRLDDVPQIAIEWSRVVEELAYAARIEPAARRLANVAATGQLSAIAAAYGALDVAVRADAAAMSPDRAVVLAERHQGSLTSLYRWFDADDRLLYVGITRYLSTRQASHSKRSSWDDFAARATVERFPTRDEAEAAEEIAIKTEHPLFNHRHNDTPEAQSALVAYLIEQRRPDLLAPAVSRG